ncbi:MAG TPA: hypothetical protein VGQ51_08370 [Puia sp.]|jgi:hypothetical protein|nr:hypothetical protein [Puia sp.]
MAKKDKKTIDMPDVQDIPGQEHIRPPRLGEMEDTTASSADEEGEQTDDPDDIGFEDIEEREPGTEDDVLNEAALDDKDSDGDPLNEKSFGEDVSGDDLDVPGADADDEDEDIGEEDEENNEYSLSKNDEEHDDLERDAMD